MNNNRKPAKKAVTRPRGRPRVRHQQLPTEGEDASEAHIYQTIVDGVMSQRLKPGTKLPEAALCELFGVGRTRVQKVLQRLAHDHVVELRPNRGACVASPTREEVGTLFEARRALEASVMPLVAKRATRDDYTSLRQHLEQEHQAMHSGNQAQWAPLASKFHLSLAALSGNPLLHRYLGEIISRCSLVVAIYQPPGNAVCEHDEHMQVVDFLERGDVDLAQQEMHQHLIALEAHIHLVTIDSDQSLADMLGLSH